MLAESAFSFFTSSVADLTGVAVQDIQIAKAVYKAYEELKNEI